jgi:YHS domain-containing protein
MTRIKHLRAASIAVLIGIGGTALPVTAAQAADRIYTSLFSDVAVGGYDPVTYFTQSKALKGSKKFQTTHEGAIWRFTSQETLDLFKADPAAYAPQYGGYCAWAVSQGYTAKGNPKNWAVHDGKLYLNYNDAVQTDWDADRDGFITLADGNWPKVLK